MTEIQQGDVFGKLEVLERITDGRYRLRCQRCRKDGVIASGMALERGRLRECWDCTQETRRKSTATPKRAPSVKPSVAKKDDLGWSLPIAA